MSLLRRRLRPTADGGCDVRLPREEREVLQRLPADLEALLGSLEITSAIPEELRRLFPAAHPRDAAEEEAFVSLSRADLIASHREALAVLAATASATHLSAEQLDAWLRALNELRLVLGTTLGVTEESTPPPLTDPSYSQWALYGYLSFLVDEVVTALSGALPAATPGADDDVPEDPWGAPPGGLRWDGTNAPPGP